MAYSSRNALPAVSFKSCATLDSLLSTYLFELGRNNEAKNSGINFNNNRLRTQHKA